MSEFCEKKGIKREYSIARTPQQNGVAKRRNRTLIEVARTMLADFKLPTTFWAEAVNTTCYVHNRVLVVKPHNKTPYKLFRGRTPTLSFMRPFECHVTILNTLDYLGKFDGKSNDGFFIGYSLNSKAFRVYNIRTRKVEENLHIRFLGDKPIVADDGLKWLFDINVLTKFMNYVSVVAGTNYNDFVGTEESIGIGHSSKEIGSSQDYIVMPLWKDGSLFDSSSKNASDAEPQPSSDTGKKYDEGVSKESGLDDQERPKNNTQDDNDAGPSINTASTNINTGSLNINIVNPTVTTAIIEATHDDLSGYETEVDMRNITNTYPVSSTPNTRIHKDHSLAQVIGDIQSGVLTRGMTKTTNEQGFISAVYEGKTHEDLHTSIQEELLQFKLQKVWILVDLPKGKRAIGTKWIFRNKKDERGIVIRNKARLVAQGYTQEEGIDYDEVFALVATIEAIRLFLAYASFMGFMVYQMDIKSAFLYGQIEEEVYVCQPLGFEDPNNPNKVYKVVKALYGLHQAPRAWYETLAKYLLDNGFHRGKIDQTLFIKKQKGDILLVQVYVDDIIFGSTKKELCIEFEKLMHDKFQMSSMGELTFFLGLQVKQKEDGIFISQDKYVANILRKFGFTDVRTASTPMDTEKPLLKDSDGDDVDVHLYRSMIGSLMYLTSSRPDIMFAVCACARFQVTPKVSHSHAVKRIFRYLKGQPKLGLWYPRDSPFDLVAYSDSDYAGASLDRKSTTGVAVGQIITFSKLEDSDGISDLPTIEIFEQLALMGQYEEASKGLYWVVDTLLFQNNACSRETEVPRPSSLTQTHVANEAASTCVDVRHGGAANTDSSLDAGQGSDRVVSLETDLQQTKKVYGAAYTNLIKKVKRLEDKLNKSRRKRRLFLSEEEDSDTEILTQKDPSKQGRKIAQINDDEGITLVQMGAQTQGRHDHEMEADFEFTTAEDISTATVSLNTTGAEISTTSPKTDGVYVDDVVAEGQDLIQLEQERLGFKEAQRFQEQFDEEERQRISSVHEEESTFKPEEWDNIQAQIKADEELAYRRKLVEECSKRQTIGEGSEPAEESKDKESDELSQEQLQQLMIIVLEERMNVEALQTKNLIID
ncbi:putative ribonuclease H-like domain-containing protein [Tanacetum coccineum]